MIKYRVWDTVTKEYLDKSAVIINGHGDLAVFDATNIPVATQALSSSSQRFVIEQYTGLKDKNGVEIAVGDILRVVSRLADNPKLFFVEMRHEEWNGDVFDLVCYDSNNDNSPIHHVESFDGIVENGEVIGNIHENAELLEEK